MQSVKRRVLRVYHIGERFASSFYQSEILGCAGAQDLPGPVLSLRNWSLLLPGSNQNSFSSPPPLVSVQFLLISSLRFTADSSPLSYNHFHLGHPHNSSVAGTIAGLQASQEGFLIEHPLN